MEPAKRLKVYNRRIVVSGLSVQTDRNGQPYVNFWGYRTIQSGKSKGNNEKIFCQAFGRAYHAVEKDLKAGASITVFGRRDKRKIWTSKEFPNDPSFIVYGKSTPLQK